MVFHGYLDTLTVVALVLALVHFTVPLAYYAYIRRFYGREPVVGGDGDPSYTPSMTVIIPTYNEARFIVGKLDDIYRQDYPRDRLEVIVVDSGSDDGTVELVLEWARGHQDIKVKVIREPVRRGKARALNEALKHALGEVVVVTDADSRWVGGDTLRRVAWYLSDPQVAAVSCIKVPGDAGLLQVESTYRSFYNIIRVAESNLHSTPVFHGELAAFKRKALEEVGGFPRDIGADDSHTATLIALRGYRAIMARDLVCTEAVPNGGYHYHIWRVRRAQHLVQHFSRTLRLKPKTPRQFKLVLYTEAYLHLVNPWLLPLGTAMLVASAITGNLLAVALLAVGVILLAYKPYRAWVAMQLYLILATLRNMWTKEIIWEKQEKPGTPSTTRS